MKTLMLVIILTLGAGCASGPTPFEVGEETTAPYGYTDMIKREAK